MGRGTDQEAGTGWRLNLTTRSCCGLFSLLASLAHTTHFMANTAHFMAHPTRGLRTTNVWHTCAGPSHAVQLRPGRRSCGPASPRPAMRAAPLQSLRSVPYRRPAMPRARQGSQAGKPRQVSRSSRGNEPTRMTHGHAHAAPAATSPHAPWPGPSAGGSWRPHLGYWAARGEHRRLCRSCSAARRRHSGASQHTAHPAIANTSLYSVRCRMLKPNPLGRRACIRIQRAAAAAAGGGTPEQRPTPAAHSTNTATGCSSTGSHVASGPEPRGHAGAPLKTPTPPPLARPHLAHYLSSSPLHNSYPSPPHSTPSSASDLTQYTGRRLANPGPAPPTPAARPAARPAPPPRPRAPPLTHSAPG